MKGVAQLFRRRPAHPAREAAVGDGVNHWPFWALVERRAAATPDARFAIDEQERELTFNGLYERSLAVAAALHARGVGEGTAVSWQLPTWIDSIVLTCAPSRLGACRTRSSRSTGSGGALRPRDDQGVAVHRPVGVAEVRLRGDGPGDRRLRPRSSSSRATGKAGCPGRPGDRCRRSGPSSAEAPVRWIYHTSGTTRGPEGALHTDSTLGSGAGRDVRAARPSHPRTASPGLPFTPTSAAPTFLIASLWSGARAGVRRGLRPGARRSRSSAGSG